MTAFKIETASNIYTSPTGVDYEIVHVEQTSLYGVVQVKGGAVPREFDGAMFTSTGKARLAIEAYFNRVLNELPKAAPEEPKATTKKATA